MVRTPRFVDQGDPLSSPRPDLPLARAEALSTREVGDEILVYDRRADEAHCLTGVAAAIWRRCDGRRDAAAVALDLELDLDLVAAVLDELAEKDLLASPPALSRRRFVTGVAAASVAPFVLSALVPTAQAQSASSCVQISCASDATCAGVGCGTCNQSTGKCRAP